MNKAIWTSSGSPRDTLAVDIGYVNALGRHEVIPIPFNQPRVATPTAPLCGPASVCPNPSGSSVGTILYLWIHGTSQRTRLQHFSVTSAPSICRTGSRWSRLRKVATATCEFPISDLQVNRNRSTRKESQPTTLCKLTSRSVLATGFRSALPIRSHGPLTSRAHLACSTTGTIRSIFVAGTAPRILIVRMYSTSTIAMNSLVLFAPSTWEGKVADGWGVQGLVIVQSGQPYSVIDYSGAVGSIYYGIFDGITNPIDPLAPRTAHQKSALTGASGGDLRSAETQRGFALPCRF